MSWQSLLPLPPHKTCFMSTLITYVSMTISLEEVSLYGWYDLFDWLQLYQNLLLIFMKLCF